MKKINKRILFVFLLIILLILKLIFVDRDVLSIVLSSSFLGFYLITFINYFRKKETSIEKKYLKIVLLLLVLVNLIQTGILLFSGKNIVLSLYNFIVSWMILNSSSKMLMKNDFSASRVFVSAIILYIISIFNDFNLEFISNIFVYTGIIVFFINIKENYFGLFDPSLIGVNKNEFTWPQLIKPVLIVLVGISYLFFPILGSILTVILWVLCFGGVIDTITNIYEQKRFNKKIKKNEEFCSYKFIYSLATNENDFLRKRLESVAKSKMLEKGIPYEVYALMDVNGYRKVEKIEYVTDESKLLNKVKRFFKENIRPEVVSEVLIKYYDSNKKISKKIEKVNDNFYKDYFKLIDSKDVIERKDDVLKIYIKFQEEILEIIK